MALQKANILARSFLTLACAASVLGACSQEQAQTAIVDELADRQAAEQILATLDQTTLSAETLANLYLDDAIILQPGQAAVQGRDAIVELMEAQAAGPALDMTHRIDDFAAFGEVVVVQGGVEGVARPGDGSGPFPFETKNLILLKRDGEGGLKIWKVIFNSAPAVQADDS
jgi:uncharacterized protein (TIGR02246 family)